MPLVRIEIIKGKDDAYKKALLDSVHGAVVKALGVGDWDRFQRLIEIDDCCFERGGKTDRFTMIEITMFSGRSKEQKAELFTQLKDVLAVSPGIQATDIFIVINDPPDENWGLAGVQRRT